MSKTDILALKEQYMMNADLKAVTDYSLARRILFRAKKVVNFSNIVTILFI